MGFLSSGLVILIREGRGVRGEERGEAEYMFWKVYTAIWTFKHILGMEMSWAFCNRL